MSRFRTFRPRVEGLESRLVPATFTVKNLNDAGTSSLRQAVLDANVTTAADTIVFKPGLEGTIILAGGEILITNNLTVTGPGASKIAISGDFTSRIFNIDNLGGGADRTVKLQGLELRHGAGPGNGGAILSAENLTLNKMLVVFNEGGLGGAINCSGQLTVVKSTIAANTSGSSGGGIFCNAAMITGSTFVGNSANADGGAIRCVSATITGSTFSANSGGQGGGIFCNSATITRSTFSTNTSAAAGGGIHATADVEMVRSTIAGNTSLINNGGGIRCGTATITNSTITGNTAGGSGHGGGISCATATITGCTISRNTAMRGGGMSFTGGGATSEIRNSTISGNVAGDHGGGIYSPNTGADLNLCNCTIAFNKAAQFGGGIAIRNTSIFLESCLVADNQAGTAGNSLATLDVGDVFQVDRCLLSAYANSDAPLEDSVGSPVTTAAPGNNIFNVEARLAPLANNGGKTQTHALKKGSPAINKGSNPEGLTTDQRGAPFKRKLGPAVDIGAFERQ